MIECDGDSIDLSGDVGAVGRIVISNSPNGNQELLLDLKGTSKSISLVSFMYYALWFLTRQGIFTNKGFEINVRVILLHALFKILYPSYYYFYLYTHRNNIQINNCSIQDILRCKLHSNLKYSCAFALFVSIDLKSLMDCLFFSGQCRTNRSEGCQ